MEGRCRKSLARCSRLDLSTASREELLDAAGSKNTGTHINKCLCLRKIVDSSGKEPLPSHPERSPVSVDLVQDTTASQSRKRRLDAASATDSLPAKETRLTRTDAQTGEHLFTPRDEVNTITFREQDH